jgi:Ca-activated chloride channel family protein
VFEGTGEAIIYPSAPPDLFAQEPLVLFGRVSPLPEDPTPSTLRITGTAAGGTHYEKTFNLNFEEAGNPAIAQLWGRARIKDLMKQMFGYETKAGVEAVTDTALTYQLLSQYTAFVAVSDDVRVEPERESISMQVPVEMPQGVNYQGIFGSANLARMQPRMARLRARSSAAPKFESFAAPEQECLDAFDTTLIDPGIIDDEEVTLIGQMIDDEDLSSSRSVGSNAQLQVVIVTGLDQAAVADLTRHLQQLNLPSGFSGEIVFEFVVNKGRVGRIVLDEEASTLKELAVIERIKRSLISWRVPQSATGTVCLTLRIQT